MAVERDMQRRPAACDVLILGALLARYRHEVLPRKKTRMQVNQAQHLAWWAQAFGTWPVADLTPARLATYRAVLARDRSAGTVNQYLRTLSHALSLAVREWGWLEANPLRRVQYLPEPRGRVRFLDEGERPRLLTACRASDNRMLYPVVMLALATGARKMEILGLT